MIITSPLKRVFFVMCLTALYLSQMARKFTEDSFAKHIQSLISSDRTHDPQYYNITPYLDSMGTTHVSVLAEDGSAVSVTSTINHMSVFEGVLFHREKSAIEHYCWFECGGVRRFKRLRNECFCKRNLKINLSFVRLQSSQSKGFLEQHS